MRSNKRDMTFCLMVNNFKSLTRGPSRAHSEWYLKEGGEGGEDGAWAEDTEHLLFHA